MNNAGHGLLDSVAQMDMAACREMFDTNFFGAVMAMQAVIPVMRQQGGGTDHQHFERCGTHSAAVSCGLQRDQVCYECDRKSRGWN